MCVSYVGGNETLDPMVNVFSVCKAKDQGADGSCVTSCLLILSQRGGMVLDVNGMGNMVEVMCANSRSHGGWFVWVVDYARKNETKWTIHSHWAYSQSPNQNTCN